MKKQAFAVFAAYRISEFKPFGYFVVQQDKVKGIIEKPPKNKLPSNLANMAIHLFANFSELANSLKEELPKNDENDDLYERAVSKLCQKFDILYEEYNGRWEILKYPWHVLGVADYFLSKIGKNISDKAYIDKSAKIDGAVVIEDEVKIMEFSIIKGPAVIKKGTIIGTAFGVAIIGMLTNGLILLNLSFYWQLAVKGFVILAAVWLAKERNE